jgi:hypothetical protein
MIVRASETEAICGAGRRLNRRQRAGDRGLARLNGRSAAEAESSVCPNQDATTVQIGEKVARSSPPPRPTPAVVYLRRFIRRVSTGGSGQGVSGELDRTALNLAVRGRR